MDNLNKFCKYKLNTQASTFEYTYIQEGHRVKVTTMLDIPVGQELDFLHKFIAKVIGAERIEVEEKPAEYSMWESPVS